MSNRDHTPKRAAKQALTDHMELAEQALPPKLKELIELDLLSPTVKGLLRFWAKHQHDGPGCDQLCPSDYTYGACTADIVLETFRVLAHWAIADRPGEGHINPLIFAQEFAGAMANMQPTRFELRRAVDAALQSHGNRMVTMFAVREEIKALRSEANA